MGGMNNQNVVVMSDDVEQLSVWKRYYPHSYVVSEASLQNSTLAGNHNVSKEQLKSSKDEMNVDLLVDFFVLTSCERIFSTMKDSRFAAEARRLHPVVGQMLAGI
jgi:hypothetical protein